MKDTIKKIFNMSIFSSILFIVIGLLLFIKPGETLRLISYIIGGLILAFGIYGIIKFTKEEKKGFSIDLSYGILSLIAGLIVILNPEALASIIPIIIGIWIVINSSLKIQYSFFMKNESNKRWKATLILSIVTLVCGILLLFNPFKAAAYAIQAVGGIIILYSLIDLIESFMVKSKVKKITTEIVKNEDVI